MVPPAGRQPLPDSFERQSPVVARSCLERIRWHVQIWRKLTLHLRHPLVNRHTEEQITDHVADELANISRAGVRGIAVSFVNYLDELPYFCAEVLPRLARLGLRETQ